MYRWLVFLHVISALLFMGAHGAGIALTFRVKRARTLPELKPILDLSASMIAVMLGAFALLGVSGIAAGISGGWWRTGWFWASVVILVGILVVMSEMGSMAFQRIRRAAGLPYLDRQRRPQTPLPQPDLVELERAIDATRPWLLTAVGLGGIVVLTWLMMFKPF